MVSMEVGHGISSGVNSVANFFGCAGVKSRGRAGCMSEPQQADGDRVAQLLDEAEQKGVVALAVLMAADLCALGVGSHAVVDEAMWGTWMGLDASERDRLTKTAFERLAQRKLLDPPQLQDLVRAQDTIVSRVATPLSIVLAARNRPTVLITGRYADVESTVGPRVYGFGDISQPVRAFVLEMVGGERALGGLRAPPTPATPHGLDQLYLYSLANPAEAARALAGWAIAPTPRRRFRGHLARSIDVYRRLDGPLLRCEQLRTRGDGRRASVEHIGQDGSQHSLPDCDQDSLRALINQVLVSAAI
jgi:hypothetical protein